MFHCSLALWPDNSDPPACQGSPRVNDVYTAVDAKSKQVAAPSEATANACDEEWPQCGNCSKTNRQCSGPTRDLKFIEVNAIYSTRRPSRPHWTVDVGSGPGSKRPRDMPSRAEDALAARLAEATSTPHRDGFQMGYRRHMLELMARRMPESSALADSMDCYLSAFDNMRRGLSFRDLLDLQAYGKALRSLHAAFGDQVERLSTATLSATALLLSIERAYGIDTQINNSVHTEGIGYLIAVRGVPNLNDELETLLYLELQGQMLGKSIRSGEDHILLSPSWRPVLSAALQHNEYDIIDLYRLELDLAELPRLIRTMRSLQTSSAAEAREAIARDLVDRSRTVLRKLDAHEDRILQLMGCGEVALDNDKPSAWEDCYTFTTLEMAGYFTYHAMFSILINRILQRGLEVLGLGDHAVLEMQNREWSERIWKSSPYAQTIKPTGATHLLSPLVMAYEAGDAAERATIMEALHFMTQYREIPEGTLHESNILSSAMIFSGRSHNLSDVRMKAEGVK
ncbi:hypothetical protein GQ53DRAFT_825068 [Thozetella sp. PMI_491]|nr:hypothetical protein GQ53DRAFT_825068 [Thozetella sp. PMI_491]